MFDIICKNEGVHQGTVWAWIFIGVIMLWAMYILGRNIFIKKM